MIRSNATGVPRGWDVSDAMAAAFRPNATLRKSWLTRRPAAALQRPHALYRYTVPEEMAGPDPCRTAINRTTASNSGFVRSVGIL
jgi:hypothetical protein